MRGILTPAAVLLAVLLLLVFPFTVLRAQNAGLTASLLLGTLPPGVTLDTSKATISGTPTTPGTYVFVLRLTDAAGRSDVKAYELVVSPLPMKVLPKEAPEARAGVAYSFTVTEDTFAGTP